MAVKDLGSPVCCGVLESSAVMAATNSNGCEGLGSSTADCGGLEFSAVI